MEFKKYRLDEIATFSQGKQVDVKEQYATKEKDMKKFTRIIDYTNASEPVRYVENYGDRYFASENDLVMIRYGSQTAGMAVMGKNGIIANNLFKINLNNDIVLNKYMYYYLSQKEIFNYLRSSQSSSTMPAISFSIMNSLEIDIPSIDYQKKAINILLKIEKKQELNNKINDNLQKFIINLYDSKFNQKEKNGKLKDIVKKVNNSVNVKNKNSNLKYFPVDVLPSNYLITKEGKENDEAKSSLIEFNKYDILIGAMRVYFHRVCLAAEDGITRTTTFVLQPRKKEYLYYALITMNKDLFIDYASYTSKGSTMPYAVWENACEDYEIYIPYIGEVENFNKIAESILEKMIENEKENRELEQLRNILLPKLMNGEIDLDKIKI